MRLLFIKIMVVLVISSFLQSSQAPKAGRHRTEASSCFRSLKIVCVCVDDLIPEECYHQKAFALTESLEPSPKECDFL